MSNEELQLARDMGAATYLSSYIHLMAQELKVEELDNDSVNAMAALMVEPMNIVTEMAFRWMVNDREGAQDLYRRLRMAIELLPHD